MANAEQGRGNPVLGLLVGAAAGLAAYAVVEFWFDPTAPQATPPAVLVGIGAFAAGLLMLWEPKAWLRALAAAAGIASVLGLATLSIFSAGPAGPELTAWPRFFWILAGMPIAGYLMTTLAKAALAGGYSTRYAAVFFHGLTLPIISAGAAFFAGLSLIVIYAWAGLLKSFDVGFFHRLFQEPWFILTFIGAVCGLSIGLIRGLDSTLGGLRFLFLLLARILIPITAVISLTFVCVLAVKGTAPIFASPYPGALMIALAFVGMLAFNGVYQNGEGEPPPAWLRLSTIVTLAAFPVYSGLAAYAFWLRIADYGLTPPRIIGLAVEGLAILYVIVCAAGLLTEFNWRAKRWMPLVAPLNMMMAVAWIAALVLLASPALNMWALSAQSQERRLLEGRVSAVAFDYGYLRFQLGDYGRAALRRLAAVDGGPEAAEIRAGAERALAAENAFYFERAAPREDRASLAADKGPSRAGEINDLPLNPGVGADAADDKRESAAQPE
jgi:hypothetical protein